MEEGGGRVRVRVLSADCAAFEVDRGRSDSLAAVRAAYCAARGGSLAPARVKLLHAGRVLRDPQDVPLGSLLPCASEDALCASEALFPVVVLHAVTLAALEPPDMPFGRPALRPAAAAAAAAAAETRRSNNDHHENAGDTVHARGMAVVGDIESNLGSAPAYSALAAAGTPAPALSTSSWVLEALGVPHFASEGSSGTLWNIVLKDPPSSTPAAAAAAAAGVDDGGGFGWLGGAVGELEVLPLMAGLVCGFVFNVLLVLFVGLLPTHHRFRHGLFVGLTWNALVVCGRMVVLDGVDGA